MKRNALILFAGLAALCLGLAGCETNHPLETPGVVEESARDLAPDPLPAGGSFDAWWIKVCPKKTDATSIRISVGPDDHNVTQKIIWQQGDPLEFQLLHGHDYNQIYVTGYSGDDGKTAYFGVCHATQVCNKHFQPNQTQMTGGEGHLVQTSDTEVWDCQ